MADREASGKSEDLPLIGGGRRDAVFLGFVALVGVAVALVNAFSRVDEHLQAGQPLPFWEPMVWEASSVAALVALTPLVLAFTRRFPPRAWRWPVTLAIHAAGAVVFSTLHVTAMGALRWAVYLAVGGHYAAFGPLRDFPYELRKDLLVYGALVGLYVVWLRLFAAPTSPVEDGPGSIEVRDGARRHFVPLTEVVWMEAAGNYVALHRGQTPILHRASLSEMERQLRGHGFVRIHRSRLVRRAAIVQVESKPSGDYLVRLADGRELMGSRRYRRPLLEP